MSRNKIIEKRLLKSAGFNVVDKKKRFSKRGRVFVTFFKVIVGIFLVFILLTIIIVSYLFAEYSRNLPSVTKAFSRSSPEDTQIYASDGTLLATVYDQENRIYVPLSQIPKKMQWAMLAAEDINFYQEDAGIDPKGILRAGINDVFNRGDYQLQGASTITQQLIKNTLLTSSQTIQRKIQELILTLKVEKSYSKDQILEAYLNQISFGGNVYGVEAAAKTYFGKDIWQLDLAQCAMLAALPQAPSVYSPLSGSNPQAGVVRQGYVLDQMLKYKNLTGVTADEVDAAKNETLQYTYNNNTNIAPHFVNYIKNILETSYGYNSLYNGGLKVYTSLNLVDQQAAQYAVTTGVARELQIGQNAHNASLVSIDPKTGRILAMVGSVNYNDTSSYVAGNINMTTAPISPGSSVKPFIYSLAFQKLGYTPSTIVPDVPLTFPGGYSPNDWDGKYMGMISVSTALLNSRNIPAVATGVKLGLTPMYNLFKTLEFSGLGPITDYGASFAIGSQYVPLLDMVHGYTIFPNDGYEYSLAPILKIYNKYGQLVVDNTAPLGGKDIFPAKYMEMINSVLTNYPSAQTVKDAGYSVAGKTGTSQDNKDLLFIGYSPDIVTGVWVGNTNRGFTTSQSWGETAAAPIWTQYMLSVLRQYPKADKLDIKYK